MTVSPLGADQPARNTASCGDGTATWRAMNQGRRWFDEANGTTRAEMSMSILKIGEEPAEVAMAWAGTTGQNPRKGVAHTLRDVAGELGDVAFTALVTVASLGFGPEAVLVGVARKAVDRLGETACETAAPQ
jgi:NTP pyrophosphatase (non-canonical NTP hydrolase)